MDDDDIIDGSDEDQDTITPADILNKLKQSWIDERMCPELLDYDGDVVDCMLDQIHQMEANLKRVKKTDFKISVHKMEASVDVHLHEVALRELPLAGSSQAESQPDSQTGDALSNMAVAPNVDTHVYLRAAADCPGVLITDPASDATTRTEEVDLVKGSQYLLRYEPISKMLHKGDVHLI